MANPWIPYLKPSVGGGEVFLILFLLVFLKVFILSGHLSPEIIFLKDFLSKGVTLKLRWRTTAISVAIRAPQIPHTQLFQFCRGWCNFRCSVNSTKYGYQVVLFVGEFSASPSTPNADLRVAF